MSPGDANKDVLWYSQDYVNRGKKKSETGEERVVHPQPPRDTGPQARMDSRCPRPCHAGEESDMVKDDKLPGQNKILFRKGIF